MSYQSMSDLMNDQQFRSRVTLVLVEQGKSYYTPDQWSIESVLAKAVLQSPEHWTINWTPSLAVEPGFANAYEDNGQEGVTDGMLLSAVQANWQRMGKLWETTINPLPEA